MSKLQNFQEKPEILIFYYENSQFGNWKKNQSGKQANKTCLWVWFYPWASVCLEALVFCDIILEGMKDCSILSHITSSPYRDSVPLLLWSTTLHHPLVISEFAQTFKHQVLYPLLVIPWYRQSCPPFLEVDWPYMTSWMDLPPWNDNSFLHTIAILCIYLCVIPLWHHLLTSFQVCSRMGEWEDTICMASQKDKFGCESSLCHKKNVCIHRDF